MTTPTPQELNEAVNLLSEHAAENLPEGWLLRLDIIDGESTLELWHNGICVSNDFDTDQGSFQGMIDEANEEPF